MISVSESFVMIKSESIIIKITIHKMNQLIFFRKTKGLLPSFYNNNNSNNNALDKSVMFQKEKKVTA